MAPTPSCIVHLFVPVLTHVHRLVRRLPGVAMLAALSGIGAPGMAAAQEVAPLRKSELVRMLSGATYSQSEIASIVTRSCLAFIPSRRDLSDVRSLGASAAVLAAIDRCTRPAASTPAPVVTVASLELPEMIEATAGDSIEIVVRALRDRTSEPGVAIALDEQAAGGARQVARDTTGVDGQVTFIVAAGTVAAMRTLLASRTDASGSAREFAVFVRPAGAELAVVVPSPLAIPPGADTTLTMLVLPRDRYGNAVADMPLSIARRRAGSDDITLVHATTASSGLARFDVATAEWRADDELYVVADGSVLARIPVVQGRRRDSGAGDLTVLAARRMEAAEEFVIGGNHAQALREYEQVLVHHPAHEEALLGRAEALVRLDRGQDAEEPLLELLRRDPANAAALTQLGWAYLGLGRHSEAEAYFLDALNVDTRQRDATLGYASSVMRRGNVRLAARLFENALERFPDDLELLVELGDALSADGREEDARRVWERALELEPLLDSARRRLAEP